MLLVGIYITSGLSIVYRPISTKITKDKQKLDTHFDFIRNSPAFTDEIDILIESMMKMQSRLRAKNAELIESREKMQELARTTLRSQETERRYISRELHDQAGQLLVSLRYTVQSLLTDLQTDPDALQNQDLNLRLSSMLVQIDKTLTTVRALSHKMRPSLLDVGDINLAMQEYCSEFQSGKKIHIDYKGASLPFIEEETAIALFRFLQESLTNVLKHAEATHIWVSLTSDNGRAKMTVKDNGKGEIPSQSQKGIGILGMKERFLLLNGTVEIQSDNEGFSITAQVPL